MKINTDFKLLDRAVRWRLYSSGERLAGTARRLEVADHVSKPNADRLLAAVDLYC